MSNIKVFEEKKIRTQWNANEEDWYFSVVDVIAVLTDSLRPRKYWNALKTKLKQEGSQLSQDVGQLKLQSSDGKYYLTDVLNTKGILRLIQSIPSPKAEPFKMWLAQIGNDRLDEIADPQKAFERGLELYRAKGYTEGWITERLKGIEIRKKLTDEWKDKGVKTSLEFAILTDEMTKAWSGMSVKEYKAVKNLKKENLRDNMTDIELTLNQLAEVMTTAISKESNPQSFSGNKSIARRGGNIARNTREDIEKELGKSIISPLNAQDKDLLEIKNNNEDEEN